MKEITTPQFGNDAITHSVYYKMVEYERTVENWHEDIDDLTNRLSELNDNISSRSAAILEMREFIKERGYEI